MTLRLLSAAVLALSVVPFANGESKCNGIGEPLQPPHAATSVIVPAANLGCGAAGIQSSDPNNRVRQQVSEFPDRVEVLRRIGVYEAALQAAPANTSDDVLAKAYARVASLYEDAGMRDKAEAALTHAIRLSRGNAEWKSQLAEEINDLGLLHAEEEKLHDAEKEELEALSLREGLGNRLEIARSWGSLSGLYFKEHKYQVSRDLAKRALDEFSVNPQADVVDRITSRMYLSVAMCYSKDCPSAVPLLKEAIAMANSSFKPTDFPVGEGKFLLGFAYWKSGDVAEASEYMQEGTSIMREQLGWGHPTYLNALGQYAKFLRESRRADEAQVVERQIRQIRQAETVVDVRSMQTQSGMYGLGGLH